MIMALSDVTGLTSERRTLGYNNVSSRREGRLIQGLDQFGYIQHRGSPCTICTKEGTVLSHISWKTRSTRRDVGATWSRTRFRNLREPAFPLDRLSIRSLSSPSFLPRLSSYRFGIGAICVFVSVFRFLFSPWSFHPPFFPRCAQFTTSLCHDDPLARFHPTATAVHRVRVVHAFNQDLSRGANSFSLGNATPWEPKTRRMSYVEQWASGWA